MTNPKDLARRAWTRSTSVLQQRLRDVNLQEVSGSLGDLGTFLPLLLSMAAFKAISFAPALFWAGFYNAITGLLWNSPMPVQPMKTIAAVVVASGNTADPGLTPEETIGAGISVGVLVCILGATGLIDFVNWFVPRPVVRGLQLGLGLSMTKSGLTMISKLTTASEVDCVLLAVAAALGVLATHAWHASNRAPTALIITVVGLIIAGIQAQRSDSPSTHIDFAPGFPPLIAVNALTWTDVWNGFLKAGLAQLPLTTLNSIVSVCDLNNNKLFPGDPEKRISLRSVASSVGLMNLSGLWFGAMPMCHGAGGLAAQHSFGARTGAAIIVLGLIKMLLAILLDHSAETLLAFFPTSLLGVLLMFAGLTLSQAGLDLPPRVEDSARISVQDERTILLATAVVTLTLKTGWGFLAGVIVSFFHHGFDHVLVAAQHRWQARFESRHNGTDPESANRDDPSLSREENEDGLVRI
ncbi:Molybdate transporter 1 [Hondaea fermentalgiana]|uniref:Molybdate transporter 1 n=1 Tax=Hondaea fermentalgiana TaxID=2315210 RepID=A0A2R5GI44_9STRA|nr:Molybdate transporter 1 [Hondaea fermentalgiana]|eukprot:GBG27544.1 Molybdate transporter 1 [Hondaea fermentalgiana]